MLEELESLGLREETVFAFLSDHGESWGERFADKQEVQGVYHMHGATLYDEIVNVPLILSAPGRLDPGVVISQVRSVDLMPTLLELAGLPGARDRRRVVAAVDGDRPAVIAGTDKGALTKLAVRMPPWKLILDVESGEEKAYNLDLDPRELDSRPADVPAELREIVFRELESAERRELTEEEEATVARSGSPTSATSSGPISLSSTSGCTSSAASRSRCSTSSRRGSSSARRTPTSARRRTRSGSSTTSSPSATSSSRTTAATVTTSRSPTTRSACSAR